MLINGYGDLESIRKVVQKDDQSKKKTDTTATSSSSSSATDQADLSSSSSRMYQMKDQATAQLEQMPDPREEKIQEALTKMERGTLMTPEVVKESIGKMVDKGILP